MIKIICNTILNIDGAAVMCFAESLHVRTFYNASIMMMQQTEPRPSNQPSPAYTHAETISSVRKLVRYRIVMHSTYLLFLFLNVYVPAIRAHKASESHLYTHHRNPAGFKSHYTLYNRYHISSTICQCFA